MLSVQLSKHVNLYNQITAEHSQFSILNNHRYWLSYRWLTCWDLTMFFYRKRWRQDANSAKKRYIACIH